MVPLRSSSGQATATPPASARRATATAPASSGQATVEFVVLLPLVAVLLAALWQLVLVGYAEWGASAAARAAARADAVGADPSAAARSHLAGALRPGLRVRSLAGGDVRVGVRIPTLPGVPALGRAEATGHFVPQS